MVLLDALESVVLNRPDDSVVATWERPSVATALSAPVHGADPEGPEFEVMFLLEAGEPDIPRPSGATDGTRRLGRGRRWRGLVERACAC